MHEEPAEHERHSSAASFIQPFGNLAGCNGRSTMADHRWWCQRLQRTAAIMPDWNGSPSPLQPVLPADYGSRSESTASSDIDPHEPSARRRHPGGELLSISRPEQAVGNDRGRRCIVESPGAKTRLTIGGARPAMTIDGADRLRKLVAASATSPGCRRGCWPTKAHYCCTGDAGAGNWSFGS